MTPAWPGDTRALWIRALEARATQKACRKKYNPPPVSLPRCGKCGKQIGRRCVCAGRKHPTNTSPPCGAMRPSGMRCYRFRARNADACPECLLRMHDEAKS